MTKRTKVAIIGAGISGLHLACRLRHSADVEIFEKSRGLGGRMSTRRAQEYQFDHGAQYFTAHSAEFLSFLSSYIDAGVVARWSPRLASFGDAAGAPQWSAPRFVAVPGMNALCKAMAESVNVHRNTRVGDIASVAGGQWRLSSEAGERLGDFDWVISTAPAEQSEKLMPECFTELHRLKSARTQACYSLMLGGVDVSSIDWDAVVVKGSPVSWIARNETKPGRAAGSCLLCQADNDWADAHLEHEPKVVKSLLLAAVSVATGLRLDAADYVSLHKWRFAKVAEPAGRPFLLDGKHHLAAAGDWCGAGRVEAAWESAEALAATFLSEYALAVPTVKSDVSH